MLRLYIFGLEAVAETDGRSYFGNNIRTLVQTLWRSQRSRSRGVCVSAREDTDPYKVPRARPAECLDTSALRVIL